MKPAPKDPRLNSAYRRRVIERADLDEEFREEVWMRCSRDPIFYLDTFGFTYSPKDYSECPDRPFILWPCQERAFKQIEAAIGKHPILGEKSRDMGFTWIIIAVTEWRWHFRKKQSFLFGSRKEEYVDKAGDPKCLFWKFDYLIDNLPGWLQPYHDRKQLHRENLDNGSTVDGESTNDNFARGDRRNAIPLDEFPSIDNGYAIERAAGDATHCPIYFGTPGGATGAFFDIRTRMMAENPERIVRLHWSEHPEKMKGLYKSEKDKAGNFIKQILDVGYEYPPDYKFILDGKLRSIAYDERERRAPNKRVMAQEWDIDYLASAWQWFGADRVAALKEKYAKPPTIVGDILFDPDWKHPRWSTNERGGKIQMWVECQTDDEDRRVPIIPNHWNDVVIACDIGLGTAGEYSSNSVASIYRRSTGQKLAQYTVNDEPPTEFCRRVMALCTLFNNAYLGWESNGPGGLFTSEVKKAGYRNVYYSDRNLERFIDEKTYNPGWHSNKDNKKILLEDYANALIDGKIENYCAEALDECAQYVHEPGGVIVHAKAKNQGKDKTDPTEAGENHGDMCFVAGTMIQTEAGEKPIERIAVGDLVLTRCGYKPVIASGQTGIERVCEVALSNGRTLIGTPEHRVWTDNRGWVQLSSLTPLDMLYTCPGTTQHKLKQKPSYSTESAFTAGRNRSTSTTRGTIGRILGTSTQGLARCMLKSGNFIMARFQRVVTFTTETATRLTTTLATWSVSRLHSILSCMAVTSDLRATATRSCTNTGAFTAIPNTKLSGSTKQNSAQQRVKSLTEGPINFTTRSESVQCAGEGSSTTSTPTGHLHVLASAGRLTGPVAVYNLSVEDCPEYFASGVLVHNCIADALANFLIGDLTKRQIDKPTVKPPPPPGSFGARSLAFRESLQNKPRRWGSFRNRSRQDA